jgi:hypothetical protein
MLEYQAVVKAIDKVEGRATRRRCASRSRRPRQVDDIKSVCGKDLEIAKERRQAGGEVSFAWNKEIHMFGPAFLLLKYATRASRRTRPREWRSDLDALQARLQHRFARPAPAAQALTHRSFSAEHNERLEFLGDSVLNLAVAACSTRSCRPARGRPVPRARQPRQAGHPVPAGRRLGLPACCGWARARPGRAATSGPPSWPTRSRRSSARFTLTPAMRRRKRWCAACSRACRSRPACRPPPRTPRPNCRNGCRAAR